jgi:leucyl-tRNA synthetase
VDIDKQALEAQAMVAPDVHRWTDGKTIRKIIVIPGRLVNIVAT